MGWARANILYDKATRLPESGSPMEMLFILLWKMRQDIEFHKQRATLQALLSQKGADDKSILKAFKDLQEAFFPFDKNQKTDEIKRLKDSLMREIHKGPLEVTVQVDPNRKKVQRKLDKGTQALTRKVEDQKQGRTLSIDAFDKARRRPRGAF